eukprot:3384596-Rhodomonas_salina.1
MPWSSLCELQCRVLLQEFDLAFDFTFCILVLVLSPGADCLVVCCAMQATLSRTFSPTSISVPTAATLTLARAT